VPVNAAGPRQDISGGKAMSSTTPLAPKPLRVAAAVIGNALEWYDFIVFGFFAVVIARLFFPA
jgi:MFS transporter, MHS family, proline/betaine transporter